MNKKLFCLLSIFIFILSISLLPASNYNNFNDNTSLKTSSDPNFYAISESDYTTRWILQDATLEAIENFTDDINTDAWSLTDVLIRSMNLSTSTHQDAYVWEKYAYTTYGTSASVMHGTVSAFLTYSYLKWETGYLAVNMTANSSLYCKGNSAGGTPTGNISISPNFNENGITWNNKPAVGDYLIDYTSNTGSGVWSLFDLGGVYSDYYVFVPDAGTGYWVYISTEGGSDLPVMKHYISKEYFGGGYMYMQTNTTENIALQSIDYTTHYNISSGDIFELDIETNSDSQINLILLKDGIVNKSLILSASGNTNFNRRTVQISVDEDVEFDQLKINSTFEDGDYIKVYDIKTYYYEHTGDYADFYLGSKRTHSVNLTSDTYNLRIYDPWDGDVKVNINLTIPSPDDHYIYEPIETIECRLSLNNPQDVQLDFTDYHVSINRSLNGEWNTFDLLDNIFEADEETHVYINVSDRFDTLINSFDKIASSYIDLELDVYRLQIKSLLSESTPLLVNGTTFPLLSGDSLYFMLSEAYYEINYTDEQSADNSFIIYLDSNQAYELNTSYHTVYIGLFTYDGLGLNRDWVRLYINDVRADFGFNVIKTEATNLTVLDYFNNTLASEIIDASAYSEYNLYAEVYSMYILNRFTYMDLIVNITQVDSGMWMNQLIPSASALHYRFIPNINYTINATYLNGTVYNVRTINLTDNSQIESFGIPTAPEEYPKNVYFGVYTNTGLGINHDLLRFYIDGNRTDFGFNRILNETITIVVRDYFNTTLINTNVNTSGIYEYNILITLNSLKIKNEARVSTNYTLSYGALETTGFILPNEIIEYQLSSNNYVFDYTNNENGISDTININLNQDRVYILNSTYYDIFFSLCDLNLHNIDSNEYVFRLNETREVFGFIYDLTTDDYNITVIDRFGISLFNEIVTLKDLNEYVVNITLYELQIRHLAQENGNLTLSETTEHNSLDFNMSPDSLRSFLLGDSTYNITWLNNENSITITYDITLNIDYILTLNTTYYDIYFSLFDQNGVRLDDSLFSLYVNATRKDFGFVELESNDTLILVQDSLNITVFNQVISLSSISEYNIIITIFELQIRHLGFENSNLTLYEITTHNNINFSMSPDSLNKYMLSNSTYNCTWINGENSISTLYNITLDENYILTLNSTYYDVYIGLYNFYGIVNREEVKFYINTTRADFGFNTIKSSTVNLTVLDYFNSILFSQTVNLEGLTEYSIFVQAYTLIVNNLYNNQTITIKITRGSITIERLIEAQGWTEFKLFPNIEYKIVSYVNETKDEKMNVDLDEEYIVVDFGFFETQVPIVPRDLNVTLMTIMVGVVFACAFGWLILILYIRMKKEAELTSKQRRKNLKILKKKPYSAGTFTDPNLSGKIINK